MAIQVQGNSGVVAEVTASRAYHVNLRKNDGTEVGTQADPVRTDPTGETPQPIEGQAADGAAVAGKPVLVAGQDGTNVQSLKTDSDGVLLHPASGQAVAPAGVATGDAFADIAGAKIDTLQRAEKFIAFLLQETGGTNGVTFRVQASIDDVVYTTVVGPLDATGAEHADGEVAVTASGSQEWFITPEYDGGAKACYRYYKAQAKSTVSGNSGSAKATIFAK